MWWEQLYERCYVGLTVCCMIISMEVSSGSLCCNIGGNSKVNSYSIMKGGIIIIGVTFICLRGFNVLWIQSSWVAMFGLQIGPVLWFWGQE